MYVCTSESVRRQHNQSEVLVVSLYISFHHTIPSQVVGVDFIKLSSALHVYVVVPFLWFTLNPLEKAMNTFCDWIRKWTVLLFKYDLWDVGCCCCCSFSAAFCPTTRGWQPLKAGSYSSNLNKVNSQYAVREGEAQYEMVIELRAWLTLVHITKSIISFQILYRQHQDLKTGQHIHKKE